MAERRSARRRSTAWRSISASPPCSWTRPSAASPSCATARSTCAWAATGRPPPTWSTTAEPAELARIFWVYGEERQARRIAARHRAPPRRSSRSPAPSIWPRSSSGRWAAAAARRVHPATRVFQALRIAVNEELAELEAGLAAAERVLKVGGRLAVVTFHSLEDRIVKTFFADAVGQDAGAARATRRPARPARRRASSCCSTAARRARDGRDRRQSPRPLGQAARRRCAPPRRRGRRRHEARGVLHPAAVRGFRVVDLRRGHGPAGAGAVASTPSRPWPAAQGAEIADIETPDRRGAAPHPPAAGRGRPPGGARPASSAFREPVPAAWRRSIAKHEIDAGRPAPASPSPPSARAARAEAPRHDAPPDSDSVGARRAVRAGRFAPARPRRPDRAGRSGRSSAPAPPGKAEDDTRLRIFFVLALFAAGFLTLALGAAQGGAVLRPRAAGRAGAADAQGARRPGRPQRPDAGHRSAPLRPLPRPARDLRHGRDRAALLAALPGLSPDRLDNALRGDQAEYYVDRRPDAREKATRPRPRACPASTSRRRAAASIRWATPAAHLIGFADKGGAGLAGAERALDAPIRAAGRTGPVPLSIDLRVQGALQDELDKAAPSTSRPIGAVGMVVNVRTGEILGMASYPGFDPNDAGPGRPRDHDQPRRRDGLRAGLGVQGLHPGHGPRRRRRPTSTPCSTSTPRWCCPARPSTTTTRATRILPLWEVFTHSSNIGAARLGLRWRRRTMDALLRRLRPVRRRRPAS